MEATWKLKRISILSAVKNGCAVFTVLGFIIGTVWGVLLVFFSSLIAAMFGKTSLGIGAATLFIMPFFGAVFYCILGCVLSFLLSLLYNISAGILGGIEVEMSTESKGDTFSLAKENDRDSEQRFI